MSIKVSTFRSRYLHPQTAEKFTCEVSFFNDEGNPLSSDSTFDINASQFPFPTRKTDSITYAGLDFSIPGRLNESGELTVQLPENWILKNAPNIIRSMVASVYDNSPFKPYAAYSELASGPRILPWTVEVSLTHPLTVPSLVKFLTSYVAGLSHSEALQTAYTTVTKLSSIISPISNDYSKMVTAKLGYCFVKSASKVDVSWDKPNQPIQYTVTIQYNTLSYELNLTLLQQVLNYASDKISPLIKEAIKKYTPSYGGCF